MPLQSLVALGVDNTPVNALGSFAEGEQAGQVAQSNKLKIAQQTLENVGGAAMYALNGDPNGEVDPAKYTEVMDSLGKMGIDVTPYRDNPNFAKIAANASITALERLKLAQGDRDYQHTMDEWQHTLSQDALSNQRADQGLAIQQQNSDSLAASRTAAGAEDPMAASIGDAIISGKQPPSTTGLYKHGAAVRDYLARQGYDMAAAQLEFDATKRHLASMNSTQQTKLGQAIDTLDGSLDTVQTLTDQWAAGNYPALNQAQRKLAKEGLLGPEAQSIVTQLESQIKDVTAELANVYMGGNSPTEQALKLAESSLNADWSDTTLTDMIALAKTNIAYRKNAIANSETGGLEHNRYEPNAGGDKTDDSDVTIEEMP